MKFDVGILRLASEAANHATARQSIIAENMANSDTPGYRAKDIASFAEVLHSRTSLTEFNRPVREGHIPFESYIQGQRVDESSAFGTESPNGNTVSIEDQMVRAAEVKHQHELALGVYQKSMNILRASLGRK